MIETSSATVCRKYLRNKILNRKFENYESERAMLSKMMKRTIESGESNSVLIVGESGIGKTMMVQTILDEIRSTNDGICIIELNGVFHTDNNSAFQDISKQINNHFNTEEDIVVSSDTLFEVLQCLTSIDEKNFRPIIFVLEDFQRFCFHGDQNLLYVLFDTVQTKKVPIFVVGITAQFNILELMEKRVQSRFSGHRIYLYGDYKFEDRLIKFTHLLSIEENICSDLLYVERWNKNIKKLSSDFAVKDILKKLFYRSKTERLFTTFLFYSVSQIDNKNADLTKNHLLTALELLRADSEVTLLKSLSVLELCLIISAYHQTHIYDDEPFNFEMIYQRFLKFARTASSVPNVKREMAYRYFETLVKLELILPIPLVTTSVLKEYTFHKLLITKEDFKEAIRTYPNLLAEIRQWADNII